MKSFTRKAAWLRAAMLALLLLVGFAVPAVAAQAAAPFSLYYQGRESLVLHRLELDPSTRPVDNLADAQAAVYQDELPAPGPALNALKTRVESGMALLVILGGDVDPAALKALTDDAVEQTGIVDAPEGPNHALEAEKFAAIIAYVGPHNDPIGTDVSWKSAVRIHERSLLKVTSGATVMVETTSADPIHPATPILLRTKLGKGTIYILNVWIKEGDLVAREHSYLRMLQGA